MAAHLASVRLGLLALCNPRRRMPRSAAFALAAWPLDSTRYPEFDMCLRMLDAASDAAVYLDVSSPRLLPLLVNQRLPSLRTTILNPDGGDLSVTRALFEDAELAARCRFVQALLSAETAGPGTYDLVTSMSVLEHIPHDRAALETMWAALQPGGRLILTLPCKAVPEEQYTNFNQYGVLQAGEDGLVFRQRLYSQACLESRVYSVTGEPASIEVWGEREPGFIQRDTLEKWSSLSYPFWSEPLRAGKRLRQFPAIDALPGEGVVGLSFVKPT